MTLKKIIFNFKIKFLNRPKNLEQILEENQRKTIKDLNRINFLKRKKLLIYSYNNIPFYKELYDKNGIVPKDINSESDWEKIPVIERKDIKENTKNLKNPLFPDSRFKKSTTGGSSGVPLTVFFDNTTPFEYYGWRILKWWGVFPWENQAYVYRNIRKGMMMLVNKVMWWPTQRFLLDCSSMSEDEMKVFVNQLNKYKPSFIQGYVGGIYAIAEYIQKNKVVIESPKAIWLTAAPFTESTREFIQKVFNAPVYDQYGCSEVFWLAAECKNRKGLHLLSDIRHLEFLGEDGLIVKKGDLGDVLITDLENKAFPIIRYKNGDQGRFLNKVCDCGVTFPLIDKIRGRVSEDIKTPNGRIINGSYLTTIFDDNPEALKVFQVIQNSDYSIDINCVLSNKFSENHPFYEKVRQTLLDKVDNEVDVSVNFVDTLKEDRGKLKFIISNIE